MHVVSNIRNYSKFDSLFDIGRQESLSEEDLEKYCNTSDEARAHHYDLVVAKVVQEGSTVTETREGAERPLRLNEWLVAPLIGRESTLGHSSILPIEGVAVGSVIDYISTGGGLGLSEDNPPGKLDPTKVKVMGILQYQDGRISRTQDFSLDLPSADTLVPVIAVLGSKSDAGKTTVCLDLIKALHKKGLKVGVAKLSGTQQRLEINELAADANEAYDAADAGMPTTYPPSQEQDSRTTETSRLVLDAAHRVLGALSIKNDIIIVEFGGDLLSASVPELLANPLRLNLVALVMAAESATAAIGMEIKLRRISSTYEKIPQYVVGPAANLKANRNRIIRETSCAGCFDLWSKDDSSAPRKQQELSNQDSETLIGKLLAASGR